MKKTIQLTALVLLLLALLVGTYAAARLVFGRYGAPPSAAARIDSIISANLEANNLYPPSVKKNFVIKRNGKSEWEQIEVVVNVGEDVSLAELCEALKIGLDSSSLDISESAASPDPSRAQGGEVVAALAGGLYCRG